MKKYVFSFLAVLVVSANSQAANLLKCWDQYNPKATAPWLIATINQHNEISNIRFIFKKSMASYITVEDHAEAVQGVTITTGRSPYKGMQNFLIMKSGTLVLPLDLSAASLKNELDKDAAVAKKYRPAENAVFITSYDEGDGAGSHKSYRLRCESSL